MKITVFDAIKYITQPWNLASEKTIQNCFAHSRIIQRNIFFPDEENILEYESREIYAQATDVFNNQKEIKSFIVIDSEL